MKIRLAAPIQTDSIVDGEGLRAVIWTQGCPHHCPGCHNQGTWNYEGGVEMDVEEVKRELSLLEGQDGITFSGGDPVFQSEACAEIARYAKEIGLNIWVYTGYLYEDMLQKENHRKLLDYVDVLVDGPFILQERSLDLFFKGSRNQRVIDVPKSLKQGNVCLVSKYAKEKEIFSSSIREEYLYV